MSDYSLFSMQSEEAGFRLQYAELLNWGVFDREIYRISPEGHTTLLTGANGAGKTTYLEAILTLLVPERKMRRYNQAAGATSRKEERTEESYVLGDIGETGDGESGKEIQRLRPDRDKVVSVILAVFRNEDRYITLAQVRWFTAQELKRTFIVAHQSLSIKEDFTGFDAAGVWKKGLKRKYPRKGNREMIEDFDTPGKYAACMRNWFGMCSEKAQILFGLTVGLKVLGNLDDFIRTNMLEESNIEEEFVKLKRELQVLVSSHNQILKAEAQLSLLEPIVEQYKWVCQLEKEEKHLRDLSETLSFYFAHELRGILDEKLKEQEAEAERLKHDIEEIEADKEVLNGEEVSLRVCIEKDEVGRQIQDLVKEMQSLEKEKRKREEKLRHYNSTARKINFETDPSAALFEEQKTKAEDRFQQVEPELKECRRKYYAVETALGDLRQRYEEESKELEVLKSQKNNIIGRVAEIRREIVTAVGAEESEIPFAGELIQVRDEAKGEWETAIEKLLHHFALQILVPAKYYAQVNRYVNEHNLRGRIIYQQIVEKEQLNAFLPEVKNSVFSKVNINSHSEYAAWVENQLRTRYDYFCTADLELFQGCKRAITPAGLIKNERRHEKDDRPEVFRRENFVLGWDNKEKIQLLKSKLRETDREIKEKESLYKQAERQQKRLADEQTGLIRFKEFNTFEEIDWQTCAVQIQQKEVQKAALEQTNERVKVLQGQLKEVTERKKKLDAEHTSLVDKNLHLKSALDANRGWQKENEVLLSTCADMDLTEQLEDFGGYFSSYPIRLDYPNFKENREKVRQQLNREIQHKSEKFQEERHQLEKLQINFKTPSEELRNRFPDWESDVHKLSDNWQYAEDYIGMYTRIKEEELVTYKEKFRKFLNKNMIKRMTDFQTVMDNQDTNIRDNIEVLNAALEKINYRDYPETYIELGIREEMAEKIRRFKLDLKGWKPNIGEYEVTKNDKILEDSFLKIKSLVDYLSENENDRRYVTDVRNWLTFIAKEVRKSDKGVYRTYESTGRLSAGERAQLTYTILASAIAYQFGISQTGNNTDSFRFICIDESFSNQDARKSGYLMELCRQLHLQLLCVTPEDKTYVVEDYISAVHFVKRKNNRNAVIYDMPIRQFKEERDKFQQTSTT